MEPDGFETGRRSSNRAFIVLRKASPRLETWGLFEVHDVYDFDAVGSCKVWFEWSALPASPMQA